MKIKKGDTVLIISGKDKGKKAKVLEAFPKERKVTVEGTNLRKKHQKPKKSGEKGQVVELPGPISVSNVKLVCPKCGKAAKVGYKILKDNKVKIVDELRSSSRFAKARVCKKCKQEV